MKTSTVNVIEENDGDILGLTAFKETVKDNKKAEKLFVKVAKENGMSENETDSCLDDGRYDNGTYSVLLVHSN